MKGGRLIRLANSIEHSYAELARIIMRKKFEARFKGDEEVAQELDALEKKIRSSLTEARDRVFRMKLSDEKIGDLVDGLEREVSKAREAVRKMRKHKNVLDDAKEAANLATNVLNTLGQLLT